MSTFGTALAEPTGGEDQSADKALQKEQHRRLWDRKADGGFPGKQALQDTFFRSTPIAAQIRSKAFSGLVVLVGQFDVACWMCAC